MAVLEVIKAGHPTLKEIAKPVERVNKKLRTLLDDMAETMYKTDGVGLAAPQINESIRVVVLDDGNGLIELINPVITKMEGEEVGLEGCLSVPNMFGDVSRATKIHVEAMNRHNKKIKFVAEDFLARIIQHEVDHLNGVLFIEKSSSIRPNPKEKIGE